MYAMGIEIQLSVYTSLRFGMIIVIDSVSVVIYLFILFLLYQKFLNIGLDLVKVMFHISMHIYGIGFLLVLYFTK